MSRPLVFAFDWVPDFARTYVRDFRMRWALEEAGIAYDTHLISVMDRPACLSDGHCRAACRFQSRSPRSGMKEKTA